MTTVALRSPKDSLLGTPTGELVLRIRGTARNGQEVRLKESRCTVGSASGCTLRLVAKGVEPQHCVLLRGVRGTIARRLAPNTRLNGLPFEDAPLKTGDVLSIGPLDFEVVTSPAAAAVVSDNSKLALQVDELRNRCNLAEAEREHWEQEARDSKRKCDDLRTELASERAVRQLGRDSLQEDQQRLEAERNALQAQHQQIVELRQQLDDRTSKLNLAQEALDQDRKQLGVEQEQLAAARKQWETEQAEAAANQSSATLAQHELAAAQAEIAEQRADLEALRAGHDAARQRLDEQTHQLQSEKDKFASQQGELAAQLAALAEQQAALARQQQELEAENQSVSQSRQQAEQLRAEAQLERQRAVAEQSRLKDERQQLAADRAALAAEQDRLAAEQEQLVAAQAELAAEKERLSTERESLAASQPPIASIETNSVVEHETPPVAWAAAEAETSIATEHEVREEPSALDEVDLSSRRTSQPKEEDVFARLRAMSLLRESDHAPVKPASRLAAESPATPQADEIATQPSPPAEPTASAPSGAQPGKHEGEESIDDYMAQLFARLNGDRSTRTDAAPNPAPPKTPAPVRPAPATSVAIETVAQPSPENESPAASCITPVEPPASEYLTEMPRRNAPERPFDLTAMRELANMSANSAIGASQRRRWTSSATIKLCAATALGAVGIGLLFFATTHAASNAKPTLFGFGAVLFVAGMLWLLQALSLLLMAWRSQSSTPHAASDSPRGSNVVKVTQVVADPDVVQDASQTP